MIALQRVAGETIIPLGLAGLAPFALHVVPSVAVVLMTVNMRKLFVLSCFVQIVGSSR